MTPLADSLTFAHINLFSDLSHVIPARNTIDI